MKEKRTLGQNKTMIGNARERAERILVHLEDNISDAGAIREYGEVGGGHKVYMFSATDTPEEGASTYSTMRLSDYSIGLWDEGVPVGVELIIALPTVCKVAANILATCAFGVMSGDALTQPGTIMTGFAGRYLEDTPLKHVMLIHPYIWTLGILSFPERKIGWLQAILITDEERKYALEHGWEQLEDLMVQREVETFDLYRSSSIP